MRDSSELKRLLSLVRFRADLDYVEGLDPLRRLLRDDADGEVLRFLTREQRGLEGRVRGGVAYVIAERHLTAGDLGAIRRLFATDDADVKQSVLNALWGEAPASAPAMGPGIVALALEGAPHPSIGVRTQACYVIQNQCGWGVDVSATLEPLRSLLRDRSGRVRMQAACAIGNLAKRKYDMARHVEPLRCNLGHRDFFVRNWSAWALWELSRSRHDIGPAVEDLVELLASRQADDDDGRKHAAGALLHHARKSAENTDQVRRSVARATLDLSRKPVKRFQEQLAELS